MTKKNLYRNEINKNEGKSVVAERFITTLKK